ncbi:hypothetical protein DM02DRAFT_637666 [Periconia macrospinosa]|uniref:Life-span regulatory factor n=1 Tax=Periconia macrospinosa TaxID=97972 RepID=A0A2V1EEF7_9PLEO|nr:hypothetical protein DM02DRAFT_637666 [Periconia macrospinosa]
MSSHMEWSPDFCLSCDRQMPEGGAYCSQACRLNDLEKGSTEPRTPSQLSSSASSTASSNGFYLPPAVNFSAYKQSTSSRGFDMSYSSHQNYYPTNNGQYFVPPTHSRQPQQQHYQQYQYQYQQQPQQQPRSLTPSSSRSSLASTQSQSTTGISAHAACQLNNYVRQFDQTREVKRRLT